MGTLGLIVDLHTQNRLDALLLLLREADPDTAWDREDVHQRALNEGLRVLLAELLANGRRRGTSNTRLRELRSA